jgi:hypothetical protein
MLATLFNIWLYSTISLGVAVLLLIYIPKPVPSRWHVKYQFMQGLLFGDWIKILKKHQFRVDPVYWHRAAFITFMTLLQSYWNYLERRKYPPSKIREVKITKDPVFIVGHYRTGTTLLHELIAMDENFAAPSTFHCFSPHSMLLKQTDIYSQYGRINFRRPMDRMRISLKSPNEDEFALCVMAQLSPYMGSIFPRDVNVYSPRYCTFDDATEAERKEWLDTLEFFGKKVLFKNPDKTLCFKSPLHTARIDLIKRMWPNAKFIHLSRNPYDVFNSTKNLHEKLVTLWRLQRFDQDSNDIILDHLADMYKGYFRAREKMVKTPNNFIEVRYEDLAANPTETLKKIYEQLELPGFQEALPTWQKWQEEKHKIYQTNTFPNITEAEKKAVSSKWKFYFDEFKYDVVQ